MRAAANRPATKALTLLWAERAVLLKLELGVFVSDVMIT
jgi:hypothetical protein